MKWICRSFSGNCPPSYLFGAFLHPAPVAVYPRRLIFWRRSILKEAEACNPGPWGNHSRVAAHCAEKIAMVCPELSPDKAYILGLLHDIGRRFGVRHLGHVSDGYTYMVSLGFDEVARVCLTHSFHDQTTDEYIGRFDTTEEEERMGVRSCFPQGKKKTKKCDINSIMLCYELWNGIVCGSVVK